MYNFPNFLKRIRKIGGLTQPELAKALGVSTILVSMIESGQKKVSKGFVVKLSKWLDIHPGSISPFLFEDHPVNLNKVSKLEKSLFKIGLKIQNQLIESKVKKLKKYASKT